MGRDEHDDRSAIRQGPEGHDPGPAGSAVRGLDREPRRRRRRHREHLGRRVEDAAGRHLAPHRGRRGPRQLQRPHHAGPGVTSGKTDQIVRTSSTNGIPSAALAAYQRAATVINAADKGCDIPWQLIAAIGRVESDHGRYGGNTLGQDGLSRPGIFGIALDGTHSTQKIADTDAGQYDSDEKFDRAVGPMQFIPSTWSVVGVDADGDAKRNPQDIDDASLATAVYLCSGDDDLGTDAGRRAAVYRYNHSKEYVDLVLRIMQAYMDGDFTSVPNNTTSAATFTPDYNATRPTLVPKGNGGKVAAAAPAAAPPAAAAAPRTGGGGTPTAPTDTPAGGGPRGCRRSRNYTDPPDVSGPGSRQSCSTRPRTSAAPRSRRNAADRAPTHREQLRRPIVRHRRGAGRRRPLAQARAAPVRERSSSDLGRRMLTRRTCVPARRTVRTCERNDATARQPRNGTRRVSGRAGGRPRRPSRSAPCRRRRGGSR